MRWLLMTMLIALPILTTPMLFISPATALAAGCPEGWTLEQQKDPADHNGDGYVCVGPPHPYKQGPPEKLIVIIDNNVPVPVKEPV